MNDIYNNSPERVPDYTNPQLRQPDYEMQSQTKSRKNATRRRIIVKTPMNPIHAPPHGYLLIPNEFNTALRKGRPFHNTLVICLHIFHVFCQLVE